MKRRTAVVGIAVVLAAAVIGGCAGRGTTEQTLVEPGIATRDEVTGAPAQVPSQDLGGGSSGSTAEQYSVTGDAASSSNQQLIVKNASLELRVEDADAAVTKVRSAVTAQQGEISELSVTGGEPDVYMSDSLTSPSPVYATITIRVAADKLDSLTSTLARLGTVISQTESASDVTEQAIDMEARLKNLRAEEERLRALLKRTNKVSELLAVEAELSRVRGEIESMDAQLTYLKRQAARATLVVTLSEPAPVTGSSSPWFGMREAVARWLRGALSVIEMLITFIIAVIPLLIVAALIVTAIVVPLRVRGRRRIASAGDDDAESEDV